jgi:hypothetical protein
VRLARTVATISLIVGTGLGGLSLVMLISGWLGLMPYPMIAGGALLMAGGIVGAVTRER